MGYHPTSDCAPKDWALPQDYDAYVKGCKTMKAAGAKGSMKQFASAFQSKCQSEVTRASFKCAEHSRLCGAAGVKQLNYARNRYECMAMKGDNPTPPKCQVDAPVVLQPGQPIPDV